MKTLILLLSLIGWGSAYLIKVPTSNTPTQPRIAPLGWVHIQKLLLPLFDNVCEESTNPVLVQLAKDFTLDASNGDYLKSDVTENLRNIRTSKGFLPKGEIFTEYNTDHVNELKALFEVFYYAKDFDTFYKAAAWARQNVNCGLFVDAIYLAIVNRKDTARVSVPAPYELLPNYFIHKDVIVKASFLLTADSVVPTTESDVRVEGNSYVLDTNYTTDMNGDEDSKLAYFREDIGLNAYYFIRKLRNAPWFNIPNDVTTYYGEHMFMMMRQFAARYDLERYSHGLPELEGFDWGSAVPYDPMLIYSNGNEFDHRTTSVITDNDDVNFLKTIESNLATVVTHLRQAGHNKAQILNHLMEILVTSNKGYETQCRRVLGYNQDSSERRYSVLEHYMTTLRDPMFWRINKKIVQLIDNALKVLPSYSRNELYFPGVEVLNIETKKMTTTFDSFEFDVTDSLKTSTANTLFQVKIAQPHLNHKPFTMKLNISSLVTKKGLVKIYIGPKTMPGELALKKHLFVLLDLFEISLKKGYNIVSRSSEEMTSFSDDFISLRTLRKKIEDAEFGLDALPLKTVESQIGYPSRLILPRGLPEGLPLQVFVFVAPLTKGTLTGTSSLVNMEVNTAALSPGYPLDLPIEIRQLFGLPNSFVREFSVIHKTESAKPNGYGSKPTSGGKPPMGGRPNGGKPAPYDFDRNVEDFQDEFSINEERFYDDVQDNDEVFDDSSFVHGLLGERPSFTYKKTGTSHNFGNKNQYRKNDYTHKRVEEVSDKSNALNSLPVHGLLGAKPLFSYENEGKTYDSDKITQNTRRKNYAFRKTEKPQYNQLNYNAAKSYDESGNSFDNSFGEKQAFLFKKEDTPKYANRMTEPEYKKGFGSKSTNKFYNYENTLGAIPNHKNVIEDDISFVGTLVPNNLMSYSQFDNDKKMQSSTDNLSKPFQYIKKNEERAVKREQKMEKYIAKGQQKKEEYTIKGEQKKEEHIAKRERKLDENVYKNDKNVKTNINNGETYDTQFVEYNTNGDFYDTLKSGTTHVDNYGDKISAQSQFFSPQHGLLGSKSEFTKIKNGSDFKTKTYKIKTQKEVNDPTKMQFKKVDYREEVFNDGKKKSYKSIKSKDTFETTTGKEHIKFYSINDIEYNNLMDKNLDNKILKNKDVVISEDTSNNIKTETILVDQKDKNIKVDKSNNFEVKTVFKKKNDDTFNANSYTVTKNKSIFKDLEDVTAPIPKNVDKNKVIKDTFNMFENNKDYKIIKDDKLNKNIEVNKGTFTKKYDSPKNKNYEEKDNTIYVKDFEVVIPKYKEDDKSTENKVFKEVYKTVDASTLNKNIQVDKEKDITKAIRLANKSEESALSKSDEDSEEYATVTIFEPVLADEKPKPKKRVTVYDFLFNPTEYTDEDFRVYE